MMRVAMVALVAGFCLGDANAENWPRFRGPNGSATVPEANVPIEWTAGNILWKTALPGVGASSPIVWGDRLFVTSATENGAQRHLICVDTRGGNVIWQKSQSFESHGKHNKNSYATSTPTTDGERVYVTFTSPQRYVVLAFDYSGKELWSRDLGGFEANHGSGASPILWRDRLIVTNDQDGPSFVAALDTKTGETLWNSPRAREKAAYSTPMVLESPDGDQIVLSSMMGLTSLDPQSGKQRWICDLFTARTVGSPFFGDGLVFATCGSGGRGEKILAVRPDGSGDVSKTHLAWESTKMLPYCPTPVSAGEHLFMVTDGGVIRCVVAKTGAEVWTHRLGGKYSASPVRVGNRIYLVSESGDVDVVAAESGLRLLAHNHLDDYFVTTPAVSGDRIYLRGEKHLWLVGNP